MLKKLAIVAAALAMLIAALAVAVWAIGGAVVNAKLRARYQAIREAGDPVTMEELAAAYYPEPPAEQNAAPLLEKAFEPSEGDDSASLEHLPILGEADLPPLGEPLTPEMIAAIRRLLADNAEARKLLAQALSRDACWFAAEHRGDRLTGGLNLGRARWWGFVLALEAEARAEQGDAAAAADSLLTMLRLAGAMQEPLSSVCIARSGIECLAAQHVERWANRLDPPPALLARVEAALHDATDRRRAERLLVYERCHGIDMFEHYLIDPRPGSLSPDGTPMVRQRFLPRVYFKATLLHYVDAMDYALSTARKPYPHNLIEGAGMLPALERRVPRYYALARIGLDSVCMMVGAAQGHVADMETARVGLATLRCRAAKGRLPKSLGALVPDFIDAVPLDPYDGEPLRYRTEGDAFVVYTLGKDGVDDGGELGFVKGKRPDRGFRFRWP